MIRTRILAVAVITAFPAALFGQVKATVPVNAPTAQSVIKSIKIADVDAMPGTVISGATSIGSPPYICGCIVAKGTSPAVKVHLGDGSVHAPALQVGFAIPHNAAHSLTIALNGADIFGVQCDAHGALKATPNFAALGASSKGYKYELRESGKTVRGGVSKTGEDGIVIDEGNHAAGEMQFGITDRGVITLYHGTHMLVIMPVANDIGAKTGGYLRFDDLGLRTAGVGEFTVISPALVNGVQPPGSHSH